MQLGKYSFGVGDRFGRQGKAQLKAVLQARAAGLDITPVWNKSHREHSIIGTRPADVRREADAAVAAANWDQPYFVDADHIGMGNVDQFLDASDFFTLDVADFIGRPADEGLVSAFAANTAIWWELSRSKGSTGHSRSAGRICSRSPRSISARSPRRGASIGTSKRTRAPDLSSRRSRWTKRMRRRRRSRC